MRYPDFDGTQPCLEVGTEPFFPPAGVNPEKREKEAIMQVCYSCKYQSQCLEWGLRHEEHGYWGGLGPTNRRLMRRKLGITFEPVQVKVFINLKEAS